MRPTVNLRAKDVPVDEIYATLNECVALLNSDLMTGQSFVYATIDRHRHTELLRKIAECKKMLVRASTKEVYG